MTDNDATKDKMRDILKLVKPVSKTTSTRKNKDNPQNITISDSSGVAIGNNNIIHNVKTEKVIERPRVTVIPGYEVITEEQAVTVSIPRQSRGLSKSWTAQSGVFKRLSGHHKWWSFFG